MSALTPNVSGPCIEHHALHHAPIITAGILTPAILLDFEYACEDFFSNAKGGINNDLKVIVSYQDSKIQ